MKIRFFISIFTLLLLLTACSSTKFVPNGEYLLDKVHIKTDNKEIKQTELMEYLRQTPNAAVFGAVFGGVKMQLGVYNLAGRDSTKWLNKTLKRMGDEPVIYNSMLTSLSVQQLQRLLENRGYINAKVKSNVVFKGKKAEVSYDVKSNKPYTLRDYNISLKNNALTEIAVDTSRSLIRPNMLFDVDVFNAERERIASRFRQAGYYNFTKDLLRFSVDSALQLHKVDVNLELRDFLHRSNDSIYNVIFKRYIVNKVIFNTTADANLTPEMGTVEGVDTLHFRDYTLVSPHKLIVKLDALVQNTYITPNTVYNDRAVERTYSALNALGPVKYANISFKETKDSLLDCYILITPNKAVSLSTELEGTYTDGYWGMAAKLNTVHRNLFKGAESLTLQFRGAFEWQNDVLAQELGVQAGLKFPNFVFPFGGYDFKRNLHANTELTSAYSYQFRPGEFSTTSLGAGVNYSWFLRRYKHNVQLFDLNYVYFPEITTAFRESFLNPAAPIFNPNSYEDHFIMRIGYIGSFSNASASRPLQNYSTSRYSIETAGNLLYGLNKLQGSVPSAEGYYTFFNIRYSQYVKLEYNYTHHQIYDKNNRFVYHAGIGLGTPYGNADVIPYEKRFYSGGANSVRGWSESTLGPGEYVRIANKTRDYNQVGDMKLDLNMEYRTKMFWLLEGALFLDAGNIWTIRDYDTQAKGTFKLDSFMSQIAIAYGLGFRFDFSFFIARVDFGVKLYNPVLTRTEKWRVKPSLTDDYAIHLAIGYPF